MECDEQDEGDSIETPTCLGSYQQAAREGKVFCPECLQSEESGIYSRTESRFGQSCFSAQKDCINTAETNTNLYILVMNSYHRPSKPLEPSLPKEFLTV